MSRNSSQSLSERTSPNLLAREFPRWVSYLAMARGVLVDAAMYAAEGESPRVARIAKAAAEAGTTIAPSWAAPLADYQILSGAYIEGLSHVGVFDRHASDMVPAPTKTRLVAVTAGGDADAPSEGGLKVISSLGLTDGVVAAKTAHCEVVVSEEIVRGGGRAGLDLLDRELRNAVAGATDEIYLTTLAVDAAEIGASGMDSEAFFYDLGLALAAIESGDSARFHIVMPSGLAKAMSTMVDASGQLAFPDLSPSGGQIANIPVEVSDALVTYASPEIPAIVVVDASQVAGDVGMVLAASSGQATVTIGGETISLFQKNLLATRVERHFGFEALRPAIAAVITGAAYGETDGSPS